MRRLSTFSGQKSKRIFFSFPYSRTVDDHRSFFFMNLSKILIGKQLTSAIIALAEFHQKLSFGKYVFKNMFFFCTFKFLTLILATAPFGSMAIGMWSHKH